MNGRCSKYVIVFFAVLSQFETFNLFSRILRNIIIYPSWKWKCFTNETINICRSKQWERRQPWVWYRSVDKIINVEMLVVPSCQSNFTFDFLLSFSWSPYRSSWRLLHPPLPGFRVPHDLGSAHKTWGRWGRRRLGAIGKSLKGDKKHINNALKVC